MIRAMTGAIIITSAALLERKQNVVKKPTPRKPPYHLTSSGRTCQLRGETKKAAKRPYIQTGQFLITVGDCIRAVPFNFDDWAV